MAQKTLEAFVVIGGRVDNSFGRIGSALINMGSTVDEVSQKLINFGKESVKVYRGYEDSMLDAQVALSTTYGRGTRELQSVMEQLDMQATEWAASTKFHTDDVANAIAQAAHANWDLEMILNGMPAAMNLAMAGGLSLSDSVDFIIKSVNAAGISFDNLDEWIDQWTFTANSSAGDVRQFGEAMLRMGSTMKFAGSQEELLVLLAALHDAGASGAEAGTLLRNSMIRLIAPTKKASNMMAELGVSQADIDEAMSEVEGDTFETMKQLEALGFSVYGTGGELRDFTDIFRDLYLVTSDMNEQERYKIWSAIFPTRTITGGIAMMEAAKKSFNGLYEALLGGDAEGYGKYASEKMMSGLTGSTETLQSKYERLQQVVGGNLAPQLESINTSLGGIIDKIAAAGAEDNGVSAGLDILEWFAGSAEKLSAGMSDMDPAAFDALCAGLGTIAVAGPGLLLAGSAFRFLGFALGTPAGQIALAATSVVALADAIIKYNEAKFEDKFGDMELDTTQLDQYMAAISKDFEATTAKVNEHKTALDDSVTSYKTAAETFSSTMLSDMLTQKELTPEDLKAYQNYGGKMIAAVKDGIQSSGDMSAEFWNALFRGEGQSDEEVAKNPAYAAIIDVLNDEKADALMEVEEIGKDLNDALVAAYTNDGQLDEAERAKIKGYMRDLNEQMVLAQREAQDEQDYIKRKTLMDKAQNLSYDDAMDYINGDIITQRNQELDWWKTNFNGNIYALEYRRDKELAEAQTQEERDAINAEYNKLIQDANDALSAKLLEIFGEYDRTILDMTNTLMHESELSGADRALEAFVGDTYRYGYTNEQQEAAFNAENYATLDLRKLYADKIKALGGREIILDRIAKYEKSGTKEDKAMAQDMQMLLDKYNIVSGYGIWSEEENQQKQGVDNVIAPDDMLSYMQTLERTGDSDMMDFFRMVMNGKSNAEILQADLLELDELNRADEFVKQLAALYDFGKVTAGEAMYNGQYLNPHADPNSSYYGYYAAYQLMGMDSQERQGFLRDDGELATVEVGVAFPDAQEKAKSAHETMEKEFPPITQDVTIVTTGGEMDKMATGGRATKPVVFGEAGPEWFIPERHDRNTANLLLKAMGASGFNLVDLAEMSGASMFADGGSLGSSEIAPMLVWHELESTQDSGAGGESPSFQVQYSPVIHADNAEGVERALMADKARLKRMLEELMEERELYESVVRY